MWRRAREGEGRGWPHRTESALLDRIQRRAFDCLLDQTNEFNGLVRDKTNADWPASIAAVGLALTAYPVGVDRGFIPRARAAQLTLTTLP